MKYAAPLASALFALSAVASAHAAGDIASGKDIFTTRCAACHHVGPSARAAFGPQLNGVFGRKAGGTDDYRYSDAMKASAVVWDEHTLRAFLQSPAKVVPGTKMRFWGMSNARQLDDLLAYLRTFQQ
ncbi:c-type cytochrome [Cupriavidus pauculus]|uniref:Cytochrome c family protein n=1 Tax=Cupriavidus pauculus TaxID=82633 RepID=A0A2N5C3R4_9BURK|nr:cytochrome c family protein [Cupriavidus pauculus]PLP96861.1 cytochrome c family protein [Cupriavidus pauculus]